MRIKLDTHAYLPTRAHPTDAGMDLYSREEKVIPSMGNATFDTGLHIEFVHGTYGKVESRSGLNVKHSVVSCGGVIDEGYTGSIVVKLYNFGDKPYAVHTGDRIAQLIIKPYLVPDRIDVVQELEATARGDGGFGSTGT